MILRQIKRAILCYRVKVFHSGGGETICYFLGRDDSGNWMTIPHGFACI